MAATPLACKVVFCLVLELGTSSLFARSVLSVLLWFLLLGLEFSKLGWLAIFFSGGFGRLDLVRVFGGVIDAVVFSWYFFSQWRFLPACARSFDRDKIRVDVRQSIIIISFTFFFLALLIHCPTINKNR